MVSVQCTLLTAAQPLITETLKNCYDNVERIKTMENAINRIRNQPWVEAGNIHSRNGIGMDGEVERAKNSNNHEQQQIIEHPTQINHASRKQKLNNSVHDKYQQPLKEKEMNR